MKSNVGDEANADSQRRAQWGAFRALIKKQRQECRSYVHGISALLSYSQFCVSVLA